MIYKYFNISFESNIKDLSKYLLISEKPEKYNYKIEIISHSPRKNVNAILISRKTIGDNEIKLEKLNDSIYCLSHNYIGQYFIDILNNTINIIIINELYIIPFLLNTVTGFLFSINNLLCLHGCSILSKKENSTFIILGNSGSGKSTIAWNLISNCECKLLSDDIVPIEINESGIYTRYGTDILKVTSDMLYGDIDERILENNIQGKKIIKPNNSINDIQYSPIKKIYILKNRVAYIDDGVLITSMNYMVKEIMIYKFVKDRFIVQIDENKIKEIVSSITKNVSLYFLTVEENKEKLKSNIQKIYNAITTN